MQRNLVYALLLFLSIGISCNDDDEARVLANLILNFDSNFDDVLFENISLTIEDSEGQVVYTFDNLNDVPNIFLLESGQYNIIIQSNDLFEGVLGVAVFKETGMIELENGETITLDLLLEATHPFTWEVKRIQNGAEGGQNVVFKVVLVDDEENEISNFLRKNVKANLVYSGIADPSDFQKLINSVTFEPGDTCVLVALNAIKDNIAEFTENVIITIDDVTLGDLGKRKRASAIINDADGGFVPLIYCASSSSNTSDEWIARVRLGSIDNSTPSNTYTDYTSISTNLIRNSNYIMTLDLGICCASTGWDERFDVWIDFNQDGDFDDAGERILSEILVDAEPGEFVSENVNIPASATLGPTRMRVTQRFSTLPGPCNFFTFGEVEDYSVNIIDPSGIPPLPETSNSSVAPLTQKQLELLEEPNKTKRIK